MNHSMIKHHLNMLRRFSSGISPLKCKKQMQLNASARESTFRRANVSLAGCSSAEPASVLVRLLISVQETIFTTCRKSQPHSHSVTSSNNPHPTEGERIFPLPLTNNLSFALKLLTEISKLNGLPKREKSAIQFQSSVILEYP